MRKRKLVLGQTGLTLLVWCAVLSGLSCGGDPNEPPTTHTLRVTVTTPGSFPDADGYRLSIGGIGLYTVPATGSVEFDLTPGDYTLQLIGVAPHCVVEDGDQRTITITAGVLTPVAFTVSCVTQLSVYTTTQGPGDDPDGYTVRIDDGDWQAIGIDAALTVPGLAAGVHSVLLGGLASNCQIESWVYPPQNPQNVTIDADHPTVAASFMVWCTHSEPY